MTFPLPPIGEPWPTRKQGTDVEEDGALALAYERRGVPRKIMHAARGVLLCDSGHAPILREVFSLPALSVMAGISGTGKSVAAFVWILAVTKCDPNFAWWIQAEEISRLSMFRDFEGDRLKSVYALVVDDLGVEYVDKGGAYLAKLHAIIAHRYAHGKQTLITTNIVDPTEFKARYGERFASRLNEDGAFVGAGGPDMRRQEKSK